MSFLPNRIRTTTGTTDRALVSKLSDWASVKDYGAQGNGSSDDAAAINTAITNLNNAGGGVLYFPPGTYIIETSIIIRSNVILQGAGRGSTILLGKAGTTHTIVKTLNFDSLTGTNTRGGGPKYWGIRDLAIHGNKANRGSSLDGIQIYGYSYEITNVDFFQCKRDGFYSEWSTDGSVPVTPGGTDYMEATIQGIRCYQNDRDGFVFTGPHDSLCRDMLCFVNGRHGAWFYDSAVSNAGATMVDQLHAYYNGYIINSGCSVLIAGYVVCGLITGESNQGSTAAGAAGIKFDTGAFVPGGIFQAYLNMSHGIHINSSNCNLGQVTAYQNSGNGVTISVNDNSLGDVLAYNNTGNGVAASANIYAINMNSCRTFNNSAAGLVASGGLWNINNIYSYSNDGNGVILNTMDRSTINGISNSNTGTQLIMNSVGPRTLINMSVSSDGGQTDYSGSYSGSFIRVAAGSSINATP